jgi:adenosylcobinamide hydrolase
VKGRRPTSLVTTFTVRHETLMIDLGKQRTILSSAPRGGGLVRARYILNHQVPTDLVQPVTIPRPTSKRVWGDPSRYLGRLATDLGMGSQCVALMTAVSLKDLVTLREESAGIWVEGFFTVGVSNAVRAGEPNSAAERDAECSSLGTINIVLITNARLAIPAMVGAVQVATESKTATLLAESVPSWTGGQGATGTGTDAIVIVNGEGPACRYSGTHTTMGELIGRVVARGVLSGLLRYRQWALQSIEKERSRDHSGGASAKRSDGSK